MPPQRTVLQLRLWESRTQKGKSRSCRSVACSASWRRANTRDSTATCPDLSSSSSETLSLKRSAKLELDRSRSAQHQKYWGNVVGLLCICGDAVGRKTKVGGPKVLAWHSFLLSLSCRWKSLQPLLILGPYVRSFGIEEYLPNSLSILHPICCRPQQFHIPRLRTITHEDFDVSQWQYRHFVHERKISSLE